MKQLPKLNTWDSGQQLLYQHFSAVIDDAIFIDGYFVPTLANNFMKGTYND